MRAVELFAGAGGLALGVAQAGFEHAAVIELDHFACETIRSNQKRKHKLVRDWPVYEVDVQQFDYSQIRGEVDLLCAGVPCQPFSVAGKGRAYRDERDMFAEVVRAARSLRPKAILIENVRGLQRSRFKDYFDYLVLAIASPELARSSDESWRTHLESLRNRSELDVGPKQLRYDVHVRAVNAADYGVPQWRERVFIVAFRSDLNIRWKFPNPTHGMDALLWEQWRSKKYWARHRLKRRRLGRISRRLSTGIDPIRQRRKKPGLKPWLTVRDALKGLPTLRRSHKLEELDNHYLNPGAKLYEGHSGSLLDEPAKTLKAGSHGVPGGENSLSSGGRIRYFSVRECARLQSFPDDYVFVGPWIRKMRQVGNAVPVRLGRRIAKTIWDSLAELPRVPPSRPAKVLVFNRGARRAS